MSGENVRATQDGRVITAGFPENRLGDTRQGGFVHQGDPFHNLAGRRNHLTR
jgi:hypothetical protein